MKKKVILIIIISLIIIIAISGVILLINTLPKKAKSKYPNLRWTVKEEVYSGREMEDLLDYIKPWEELGINEQFAKVEYGENAYYSNGKETTSDVIEKQLGIETMYGYDKLNNINHSRTANIYKIKGINEKCAIAAAFDNKSSTYIYVNQKYSPNTLEELIEDLNLKENMTFGSINYSEIINGKDMSFEFTNVPTDKIFEILFNNSGTKDRYSGLADTLLINTNIKLFGDKYTFCRVTEKGYLIVHISYFEEMSFYIGEEKTKAFFNYVFDNYKAEATVYIEETIDEPDDPGTIMVMENTL